jgi:ParB-like chromosome segregation protein Spo0J
LSYPKYAIVDSGELTPPPSNPNIMTPENEAKLEASIKRFGFFRPVIVRELEDKLEIVGGEHRWEIARRHGMKVPIMNLGPISDQEAREILLADNARYGVDDTLSLAEFLKEMGDVAVDDLQDFLPYTETDLTEIFSSVDIALDDLDIAESFEKDEEKDAEPPAVKAPKTHTIMRFKVALADAERLTEVIAKTQKHHGYTTADELTNAGDALVHLVFGSTARIEPAEEPAFELDDIDEIDLEDLGE